MSLIIKDMKLPQHAAVNGEKDTAYKCVILAHADNSVKRHYDKFCKHHNGYIHHWHETTKDEYGNYIDSYTYEIVNGR